MNKEDILVNVYADTWLSEYKDRNDAIEHVKEVVLKDGDGIKFATASYKTMDQFAKQTAVFFAEWVVENTNRFFNYDRKLKGWSMGEGMNEKEYTIEQLYELYLQSIKA